MQLETVTGQLVDVENPDPATINIEDIAWGLSRISRFCGHTITIQPYSVAQHSVFVANKVKQLLDDGTKTLDKISLSHRHWDAWMIDRTYRDSIILKALVHDAAEVYTGDLPSPIKQIPELTPIIKKIESNLMGAIYKSLNLSPPDESEEKLIKYADKIAQRIEAHAFMPSRGRHWPNLPDVTLEELQQFETPKDSLTTYKMFMACYSRYHTPGDK